MLDPELDPIIPEEPPVVEDEWPVSLELAKAHLRILDDTEDTYIKQLIQEATNYAEGYHNVIYGNRAMADSFDTVSNVLELSCKPIISLTSVTYTDENNEEQDITDNFWVDKKENRLIAKSDLNIKLYPYTSINVAYRAGMAPRPRTVQAMLIIMGQHYELREAAVVGLGTYTPPLSAISLLEMDRHPL